MRVKIIEDCMGDFTITKTESGWTVIKDGVQYNITDTNGNGKYDGEDKIVFTDPNSKPLTPEDQIDIRFKTIVANPEGMTPEEMTAYSNYIKQKERKEQQKQEQERIQAEREAAFAEAQKPQKQNFWSKLMTGFSLAMPLLSGIGAGFIGASSNSWQYNSGDKGLRWMSGITSGLLGFGSGLTAMMATQSMSKMFSMQQTMPAYNMNSNINLDNMMQSFYTDMNTQNNMFNQMFDTTMAKRTKQQEEQQQKVRAKYAEQIHQTFKEDDLIPETNKAKLQEIAPASKDSSEYTEEDEQILQQLAATPFVPVESIDVKGDQKGKKLSKEYAMKINQVIKEYNAAIAEDTPEFNKWKNNIEYLQKLISANYINNWSYESITKAIDEILSDPKKKQLTTQLTK